MLAINAAEVSGETKIPHTLPSSNYPFIYFSPTSQKVRARKLTEEWKNLNKQTAKFSNLSVTLDNEQDKQMAEIVATVEGIEDLRSAQTSAVTWQISETALSCSCT